LVLGTWSFVWSQGYGFANVARKTPVRPDTVLKIGSVSKQFIATGSDTGK